MDALYGATDAPRVNKLPVSVSFTRWRSQVRRRQVPERFDRLAAPSHLPATPTRQAPAPCRSAEGRLTPYFSGVSFRFSRVGQFGQKLI
jgi:hypothetical protein